MGTNGAEREMSRQSRDSENDEGMVFKSSFERLLYRLSQEHKREVSHLQNEIFRLKKNGADAPVPEDIASELPPSPIKSGMSPVPPIPQHKGNSRDQESLHESINDFLQVEAERPDEDALAAAFAIVTGIEENAEEANMLPQEMDFNGSPGGEAEDRGFLSGKANNGSQEQAWWKGQEHRWSGAEGDAREKGTVCLDDPLLREKTADNALLREGSDVPPESTGSFPSGQGYKIHNGGGEECRDSSFSALLGSESLEPISPMDGWHKLIESVRKQQALEILPKLNPIWKAENMQAKGVLGIDLKSVVSKVAKVESVKLPDNQQLVTKRKECCLIAYMQPLMMHPTCRRRVIWDLGGIILLLHDLIFIPMEAFQTGTEGIGDSYRDFQGVLDFSSAVFWTLDICVSFLTGFYSAEGFVELYPPRVARHYMKGWFPMDTLIVATDWSTMYLGMSSASGYMRLGKTVSRFMRVLRLLRFLKMNTTMKEMMERINSEYVLQLVNLLKTLVFIVVINHYIACVWYGLGSSGFFDSKWPEKFLVNYPNSFGYAYTTSLHWSLTQFTPASMEVVPQNFVERFFTIMVIIMALVAFSSFVSSITAAMTHIRQIKAKQLEAEAKIRQFFSEHKISHGMASRVWHFLRKNKSTSAKRLKESDVPALKNLPQRIKEDMRVEIYLPILREHPFLQNFYFREETSMWKICNQAISERSLQVGEELFKPSDPIKMFFVAGGQCCYTEKLEVNGGLQTREFILRRGDWTCEVAVWADKAVLEGPFGAVGGPADVIILETERLSNILKEYDNSSTYVTKYAERFMERFIGDSNTITHGAEYDDYNVLFNDPEMIMEFVRQSEESCTPRRSRPRDLFTFGGGTTSQAWGGRQRTTANNDHKSKSSSTFTGSLPPVGTSTNLG